MTWFGWLMVTMSVLGILTYVAMIGKPRNAITPTGAAIYVGVQGLVLVGLLIVGTGKL